MKQASHFLALVALLTAGCGAEAPAEQPQLQEQNSTAHALRKPSEAALLMASEEKAAIELAKLAQHRQINRTFRDYVRLQQQVHEELLAQLQKDFDLPYVAFGAHGATMWSALQNRGGVTFQKLYFDLQRPWQKEILQRLEGDSTLPRSYVDAAHRRWSRDLAALEAIAGK